MVTNPQIQNSFDQDIRPICNALVILKQRMDRFIGGADDLYASVSGSDWTDGRTDGPPHLAVKDDWYAVQTFISLFQKVIAGTATTDDIAGLAAQWPIVKKMSTRDLAGV